MLVLAEVDLITNKKSSKGYSIIIYKAKKACVLFHGSS